MISNKISEKHILKALKEIDRNGIPNNRKSKKYHLVHKNKSYPPKYVLSIAGRIQSGTELEPSEFGGGSETNQFLKSLGFKIQSPSTMSSRNLKFLTAILESDKTYDNSTRIKLLEDVLSHAERDTDVIVLPAGFLSYRYLNTVRIKLIERKISSVLKKSRSNAIVCFGVDNHSGEHQLGFAITKLGVQAIGRKFFPTADEKDWIQAAKRINEQEFGFNRVFNVHGKKVFLAVCYDGFGIKHQKQGLENIDFVVDVIHQFAKKGEGPSGEVYFAKHGLAGAAKRCDCPVLASSVFFNREIPTRWPSGVIWRSGKLSTQKWKYDDNGVKPTKTEKLQYKNETVEYRYFNL